MGSWSETCGLTGLPIQYGDPVMLTFLVQTTSHGRDSAGTCYPTGWWTPYSLPISATYADYGGIEAYVDNWNVQWILKRLRTDMLARGEGENIYHDYAVCPSELDSLQTLMKWINNDRVLVNSISKQESPHLALGWMMCHKWAYEYLARQSADYADRPILFEQTYKQGQEWYRSGLKITQDTLTDRPNITAVWRWLDGRGCEGEWLRLLQSGSSMCGFGSSTNITSYKTLCEQWVLNKQPVDCPKVSAFLYSMSQFLVVSRNMGRLRKHWSPQSGKGSQNCDLDYYQSWLQECQTQVSKTLRERDSEFGDVDDETSDEAA